MTASSKITVIQKLGSMAFDHPEIEEDILNLIRKVVDPEPAPTSVQLCTEPTDKEMLLLSLGRRIDALKSFRDRTRLGLKEAKEAVDRAGYNLDICGRDGRLIEYPPKHKVSEVAATS